MIIDLDMLVRFGACKLQRDEFAARFPNGLDVSGLWGTAEERSTTWRILLADEFLRRNAGWAIANGLVPARITADLWGANLTDANLTDANLWGANLTRDDIAVTVAGVTICDKCAARVADVARTERERRRSERRE